MHEWMNEWAWTSDWVSEWARHSECATQCGQFKWIYFYCRRIRFCFLLVILLVFFLPSIFHLLPFISRTSISVALSLALRFFGVCFISVYINEIYVLCIMRTFVSFSLSFFLIQSSLSLSVSRCVNVFSFSNVDLIDFYCLHTSSFFPSAHL